MKQILEALVSCRSSLVIAIDGLDECEEYERSKILSFVLDVSKQCSPEQDLKFFLTSRREEDIRLSLHSAFSLNIEPEYVEGDIRAYVKLQTAKLGRKFEFNKAKECEIAKEVLTRPKGKLNFFPCSLSDLTGYIIDRNVPARPINYGELARSGYNT